MAQQQQQEDRQKNSNNKKAKERKVPQRGLGVAQLEKIRLESQKKPPPTPTPPPPQSRHSSCSTIQSPPPIFRHNSLPSPTSISFPPPPPPPTAADLVQRNAILRRASSTPSVGFGHLQPGPLPFLNTDVGNRWPVISNLNHQVQPSHRLLLTYLPKMNLAYDTRPVHPPQNVILQRPQQVQEQPSPSSLVNVPPPPTSSTPPVITNQSIYDKNYSVVWSEAKIAGMKRPYPFSLDLSNPSSLPSKLPQMVAPGVKTLDQSGSGVTGSVGNAEMSNLVFREGSSTPPNPKVTGRENGGQNRDFLTLVPPRTASSTLDNREIVDLESPSFQGRVGQPDHPPGPSDRQKPLYSFFPPRKADTTSEETARSTGGGSKEAGEKLDLSLKL